VSLWVRQTWGKVGETVLRRLRGENLPPARVVPGLPLDRSDRRSTVRHRTTPLTSPQESTPNPTRAMDPAARPEAIGGGRRPTQAYRRPGRARLGPHPCRTVRWSRRRTARIPTPRWSEQWRRG